MTISLVTLLALSSTGAELAGFTVALKQRNVDILHDAVMNMSNYTHPDYGKYWSRDQVLDLVAPSLEISRDITTAMFHKDYLCQNYRDALDCVPMFQNMSLPDANAPEFNGAIEFIEQWDKDTPSGWQQLTRTGHVGKNYTDTGFFGRESLLKLYNISSNATGQNVAAVEYTANVGFDPNNLAASQYYNGQTSNPVRHVVGINQYSDGETELDLQMLSQVTNGADLWYWEDKGWLYSWAMHFFSTEHIPTVTSHSWGWAVTQQCSSVTGANCTNSSVYVSRVNVEYLKISARGTTIVTASGDAGAPGRTNEGCSNVTGQDVTAIFPGSSPYVLSVGATYVVAPDVPYNKSKWHTPLCVDYRCTVGTHEAPVNFKAVSWTAGGGFSLGPSEAQLYWQQRAVDEYLAQGLPMPLFNRTRRAYPDIATIGHNCPTWAANGTQLQDADGTSCASPIMAGIVALLNKHQELRGRSSMGMITPVLYSMYYDDPTIFNHVQPGNNWCTEMECCPTREDGGSDFGYMSGKGFDPVTGLGTPNVGRMLEWLDRNT